MSFARLQNEMRRQATMAAQTSSNARLAIVTSFDPNRYACKVLLQPQGIETGWLPVKSTWVGNGWGLFCPPSEGNQVAIDFQEGAIEAGLVSGGIFSDEDRPLPAQSGEYWLVHQSGSCLKLTNDSNVTLNAAGALNITVGGAASITVTGAATLQAESLTIENTPTTLTGGLTVDTLNVTTSANLNADGAASFIKTVSGTSTTAKA